MFKGTSRSRNSRTKLEPGMRATIESEKESRRHTLLDCARSLFKRRSLDEISVQDICTEASLAKGTFYLYFATKEAAFLALVLEQAIAWSDTLDEKLTALKGCGDPVSIADVIATSFAKFPQLPRLLSTLHHALERNVSAEEIVNFKSTLFQRMNQQAQLLRKALPAISATDSYTALAFCQTTILGSWQIANPPKIVLDALSAAGIPHPEANYEDLLRDHMTHYLRGLLSTKSNA